MKSSKNKKLQTNTKEPVSLVQLLRMELDKKLEAKYRIQNGDNIKTVSKELDIQFVQPL